MEIVARLPQIVIAANFDVPRLTYALCTVTYGIKCLLALTLLLVYYAGVVCDVYCFLSVEWVYLVFNGYLILYRVLEKALELWQYHAQS